MCVQDDDISLFRSSSSGIQVKQVSVITLVDWENIQYINFAMSLP